MIIIMAFVLGAGVFIAHEDGKREMDPGPRLMRNCYYDDATVLSKSVRYTRCFDTYEGEETIRKVK